MSTEDDSYLKTGGVKPVNYQPPKKPFVFTKDEPEDAESQKKALYLEGYGRQFGEKMTYSIGLSYGLAVGTGGAYGALMGLKKPAANNKLRLNAVLNGAGSKGPVLANQCAVITMFYVGFNNLIGWARGEDDAINAASAGALAGGLFKSTTCYKLAARYSLVSCVVFTGLDQALRTDLMKFLRIRPWSKPQTTTTHQQSKPRPNNNSRSSLTRRPSHPELVPELPSPRFNSGGFHSKNKDFFTSTGTNFFSDKKNELGDNNFGKTLQNWWDEKSMRENSDKFNSDVDNNNFNNGNEFLEPYSHGYEFVGENQDEQIPSNFYEQKNFNNNLEEIPHNNIDVVVNRRSSSSSQEDFNETNQQNLSMTKNPSDFCFQSLFNSTIESENPLNNNRPITRHTLLESTHYENERPPSRCENERPPTRSKFEESSYDSFVDSRPATRGERERCKTPTRFEEDFLRTTQRPKGGSKKGENGWVKNSSNLKNEKNNNTNRRKSLSQTNENKKTKSNLNKQLEKSFGSNGRDILRGAKDSLMRHTFSSNWGNFDDFNNNNNDYENNGRPLSRSQNEGKQYTDHVFQQQNQIRNNLKNRPVTPIQLSKNRPSSQKTNRKNLFNSVYSSSQQNTINSRGRPNSRIKQQHIAASSSFPVAKNNTSSVRCTASLGQPQSKYGSSGGGGGKNVGRFKFRG